MAQFPGYLHSSAMATPFTMTESTDVSWGPKAYYKEATTSLSHCAVLCRMSATSNQGPSICDRRRVYFVNLFPISINLAFLLKFEFLIISSPFCETSCVDGL